MVHKEFTYNKSTGRMKSNSEFIVEVKTGEFVPLSQLQGITIDKNRETLEKNFKKMTIVAAVRSKVAGHEGEYKTTQMMAISKNGITNCYLGDDGKMQEAPIETPKDPTFETNF